ncbi:MAG: hypothetical protein ACLURV_06055 [Gallintestinimicrobium sp.]
MLLICTTTMVPVLRATTCINVSSNGETYTFLVESYLCDKDSDVYKAVKICRSVIPSMQKASCTGTRV